MNYSNIYDKIIEHAKKETLLGKRPKYRSQKYNNEKFKNMYFEMHHIKPRKLFPELKSDNDNIVALTAKEHYFCHKLLDKIYPNENMFCALWYLANDGHHVVSAREYERLKERRRKNTGTYFNKGKKLYNNGEIEKYFIEGEQDKGFIMGKLEKHMVNNGCWGNGKKSHNNGKVTITNGKRNTYIEKGSPIPEGFWLGCTQHRTKVYSNKGQKCVTKGMHHYTDGVNDIMAFECPPGFVLGRPNKEKYATTTGFTWWNNGVEQKFCKEKPDENWVKGRLIYGKNKVC